MNLPEAQSSTSKTPLTKRKYAERFTYDQQLRIVYGIATYLGNDGIKQLVREEFGREITKSQLQHYRWADVWKPTIQKFREEFEAKIADEELSSKRRRIQELTKAYKRLEPSDDTLIKAVDVLAQIREEVEGKSNGGNSITQYNQYNGLSDTDLRKIIDENNRFLEIAEKRKIIEIKQEDDDGKGN